MSLSNPQRDTAEPDRVCGAAVGRTAICFLLGFSVVAGLGASLSQLGAPPNWVLGASTLIGAACFVLLYAKLRRSSAAAPSHAATASIAAIAMVGGLYGAIRVGGVAMYMHSTDAKGLIAGSPDGYGRHCCLTAYAAADELAFHGAENIYDPDRYDDEPDEPTSVHQDITGKFGMDNYQYPPPFLLLPRVLAIVGEDFLDVRAIWFALSLWSLVGAALAIAVWCGGLDDKPMLLLVPLLLAASPVLGTLQTGNAHVLVIALSLLGMLLIARGRPSIGGLLLAYAIVAKIFPGLLGLYLLTQRRWRAAAWTAGWGALLIGTSLVVYGLQPWESFIEYQVPRLSSGEAFWWVACARFFTPVAINMSLPGTAFKVEALEAMSGSAYPIFKLAGTIYTIVVPLIVIALAVSRRRIVQADRRTATDVRYGEVLIWVVVLLLGQWRSPFLPWGYGAILPLLLVWLLLPAAVNRPIYLSLLLLCGFTFSLHLPLDIGGYSELINLDVTLLATGAIAAMMVAATVIALRKRGANETAREGEGLAA